jgi:sulfite reductase (ferredoxin)
LRFAEGDITAEDFKALRVPLGVYEQREPCRFMLRLRLPGGALLPHQMRALADASETRGNGILHVTTRQDVQVHRVALDAVAPALRALFAAGLSAKGGGGNTVRNISACPHAGVCAREAFDVTPCALALTEFLLDDAGSFRLPRKYKIAFSGCPRDCAGATVNDLGFVAHVRNGVQGFAVHVAGGLGARSRVARPLEDFVPAAEIHLVAEAVKRVFDAHGDRSHRSKARLRFLVDAIGIEAFAALYREQLALVRREAPALPRADAPAPPAAAPSPAPRDRETPRGFDAWRRDNVALQKQPGRFLVYVPLVLGDIPAKTFRALGAVAETYGEGVVRTTQAQNLVLRHVREDDLPALHEDLSRAGLAAPRPPVLQNLVACAGAATCRLGLCLSRGLAGALARALRTSGLDLRGLGPLDIRVSGCANACGRHPVADVGFSGVARRADGRFAPHYTVHLGGAVGEGRARLAERIGTIPARNVPRFLTDLLGHFLASPTRPDFDAFLADGGREAARELLARHRHLPAFEDDNRFYVDWGAMELFSPHGRGESECATGEDCPPDCACYAAAEKSAAAR